MKKGFTMIELIFVIVILGVLAAIAIPRLTATRDDADAVAAASKTKIAMQDFSNYYISQGYFIPELDEMTNVDLPIKFKGEVCTNFEFKSDSSIIMRRNKNKICDLVWNIGNLGELKDTLFSDGIIIID